VPNKLSQPKGESKKVLQSRIFFCKNEKTVENISKTANEGAVPAEKKTYKAFKAL
jgi:hypothetical protein